MTACKAHTHKCIHIHTYMCLAAGICETRQQMVLWHCEHPTGYEQQFPSVHKVKGFWKIIFRDCNRPFSSILSFWLDFFAIFQCSLPYSLHFKPCSSMAVNEAGAYLFWSVFPRWVQSTEVFGALIHFKPVLLPQGRHVMWSWAAANSQG